MLEENVRFEKNHPTNEIGGRKEVGKGKKKVGSNKTRTEKDKMDVNVGGNIVWNGIGGGGKKKSVVGKNKTEKDATEVNVGGNIVWNGASGGGKKIAPRRGKTEKDVDEVLIKEKVTSKTKSRVEAKPSQERDRDEVVFVSIDKVKDFTRPKSDVKSKIGKDNKEIGVEDGKGRKSVEAGNNRNPTTAREQVKAETEVEPGTALRFKSANKERQSLQLAKTGTHDDIEFLPVGKLQRKAEISAAKKKKHKIGAKTNVGKETEVPMNDQKTPKTKSKLVPKQGTVEGEDDDDVRAQKVKPKKSTRNEVRKVPVSAEGEEKDLKMAHPKQLFF